MPLRLGRSVVVKTEIHSYPGHMCAGINLLIWSSISSLARSTDSMSSGQHYIYEPTMLLQPSIMDFQVRLSQQLPLSSSFRFDRQQAHD